VASFSGAGSAGAIGGTSGKVGGAVLAPRSSRKAAQQGARAETKTMIPAKKVKADRQVTGDLCAGKTY